MAAVHPVNGNIGADPAVVLCEPSRSVHPVQSTGYAQGYYLPAADAYPAIPLDQPGQSLVSPPLGQPIYPVYDSTMPTACPIPQAYVNAPPFSQSLAAPYPGHTTQPDAIPYGAPPLVNGDPPGCSPQYGTSPVSNSVYPISAPLSSHPVVVYPMAVAVAQQGNTNANPAHDLKMREWSVGLFDCCHDCIPNLFTAWCCPCISLAQIYARLGLTTYRVALMRFTLLIASGVFVRFVPIGSKSSRYKRYNSMSTASSTPSSSSKAQPMTGTVWYAFLLTQQLVLVAAIAFARSRTRHRFKIPGNGCSDGLVSCICPCCTIAQVATHIRSYTPGACDFGGPDVLPAFQ